VKPPRAADTPRQLRIEANELLSIASKSYSRQIFVGALHLTYLPANGLAIAVTSAANFLLSELFVFRVTKDRSSGGVS